MTVRPNLLRTLNASKGLKAIADPRFKTAVLGGGALPGLTLRAKGYYLEGNVKVF
jgi:hypothetical protein